MMNDDKLLVIFDVLTVTGVQILKIVYWALVKKSCRSTPYLSILEERGGENHVKKLCTALSSVGVYIEAYIIVFFFREGLEK